MYMNLNGKPVHAKKDIDWTRVTPRNLDTKHNIRCQAKIDIETQSNIEK
jgi:hypothetical protein